MAFKLEFATAAPSQNPQTIPRYETLDSQDLTYDPSLLVISKKRLPGNKTKMAGGKRVIFASVTLIAIPMIGLAALLLVLVLVYEVQFSNQALSGSLSFDQSLSYDRAAYYVDFNPTTLVTIASWSSTVAPLLAVCAMILASFPIARTIKVDVQVGEDGLPTPFQLGMLIEALSGGVTPFFSIFSYCRWPQREKLAPGVRSALILLGVFTGLGYTIAAVDTWLHLVMDAVNIQLTEVRIPEASYGRGLPVGPCVDQQASEFNAGECSINADQGFSLVGASEAARVMGNSSQTNAVYDALVDGKLMAYVGPASKPEGLDFGADALAMHTECTMISRQCNLQVTSNTSEPFACTESFYGDLAVPSINGQTVDGVTGLPLRSAGVVFFQDASLNKQANSDTGSSQDFLTLPLNPHYLAVWARTELPANPTQTADGNVIVPSRGGTTWLLNCSSTAYEIGYSFVNGSIRSATAVIANGSVGTILNSGTYYGFGKVALETAAYAASQFNDTQAMADSWAQAYSQAAMSLSAGFMSAKANTEEQRRSTRLVSRVPKAPLYTLVSLNTIYALLGVLLGWLALGAKPDETNDLRERLSTSGLVAYCFEGERATWAVEGKREMFGEFSGAAGGRVGLVGTDPGGYSYVLRNRGKMRSNRFN